MGLIVSIARTDYDSELNAFHGKSKIVVVNIEGPFEPTDDMPAARLSRNALGEPIIVPDEHRSGQIGPMMGGTYAASSDSRFGAATQQGGAVAIHDRYETPVQYAALSR